MNVLIREHHFQNISKGEIDGLFPSFSDFGHVYACRTRDNFFTNDPDLSYVLQLDSAEWNGLLHTGALHTLTTYSQRRFSQSEASNESENQKKSLGPRP